MPPKKTLKPASPMETDAEPRALLSAAERLKQSALSVSNRPPTPIPAEKELAAAFLRLKIEGRVFPPVVRPQIVAESPSTIFYPAPLFPRAPKPSAEKKGNVKLSRPREEGRPPCKREKK